MIKLYVAIPTTSTVVDAQTYALRDIEKKYKDQIEFIYPKECTRRMFHDYARNAMVEDFLASGADILWFLDSDVSPPVDVLDIVTEHSKKWIVAGAPYPIFVCPYDKLKPQVTIAVYNGTDGVGLCPTKIPYEGTAFVDGLATGCLFIKRELFAELEKPYFEFKFDPQSRQLKEGEDLGFCFKVNKLGYKFFVDYGKICKHYKTVCLLEINNYAIDYANRSVQAYDASIRSQVEELIKRATQVKATKSAIITPFSK